MSRSIPMETFARDGIGVKTIQRELGKSSSKNALEGCYVLHRNGKAEYVGISRKIITRLRQHVRGKTHFDASLAYRMAKQQTSDSGTRSEAMACTEFQEAFQKAKEVIRGLQVAYVEIDSAFERYVFEPYCSMQLKTGKWNKFDTH